MNVLEHYNKENISLGVASQIDDDTYFCRMTYNNAPFIIKTNKVCFYRKRPTQYKTTDNYINISLTSKEYLEWFDQFYNEMIEIFHKSSEDWFEEPLTLSDVEFCFINPLKSNIKNNCFDIACAIDEERIIIVDTKDRMIQLSQLKDSSVIPSFHIKGIKFNNKHFIFEIELINLCIILDEEEFKEEVPSVEKEKIENITLENLNIENTKPVKNELNISSIEEDNDELKELNIDTENLDEHDLEIEETGIYKVYDFINEKIKENMIEHIRKVFINKKIKTKLDFYEMVDDEDSDAE
jgi:hypothetical protein